MGCQVVPERQRSTYLQSNAKWGTVYRVCDTTEGRLEGSCKDLPILSDARKYAEKIATELVTERREDPRWIHVWITKNKALVNTRQTRQGKEVKVLEDYPIAYRVKC